MIPYGRQEIDAQDIDSVVEVLRSDLLTQGECVPQFEQDLCAYTAAKYGCVCSHGTAALHLACLALGLQQGDVLWTSAVSFVASANCGLYCGASIDFVDIDVKSYNLCVPSLEVKLQQAKRHNALPKILVVVHMCGQVCDMQAIYRLSKDYGFSIIEDACHALGSTYKGQATGCCEYADISVFSFHPVKSMTTAEGGAALTNDVKLAEQMSLLRGHGITRSPMLMTHQPEGDWYYQQIALGYNYRMSDLQAALGMSQLQRLDQFMASRRSLAARYDQLLQELPVVSPVQHPDTVSSWHLYVIQLQLEEIDKTRAEIFTAMRDAGVGVHVHYIPIYRQPYFQQMGFDKQDYPGAEKYYAQALTLPLHTQLKEAEQFKVVNKLAELLQ
jgi:UDP-4-amino-4,6-dideoxy-N-acetyl-beta-L-altrosamine transaminase